MKLIKKVVFCMLIVLAACGILFALSRHTNITKKSEELRPPLFDTPSYVEVRDGEVLTLKLHGKKDCSVGTIAAVIVNTDSEGDGNIDFSLFKDNEEIFKTEISEKQIVVGEWTNIPGSGFGLEENTDYKLIIEARGCNPYFMKTQLEATNNVLPFEEIVTDNGGYNLECGISLGTILNSEDTLTYGEIFYYSETIVILAALLGLALILLGTDRCIRIIRGVFSEKNILNIGNEVFLLILFVTICFSIYINGYLEGIYISADSAGYLREAVNLAAGHGFHYDGLAGYDNTWFANWPVLYPFLIAVVMKLTGMEVYAASKVLSMILVGTLILIIRLVYKKDAWVYALFMTNLGLMYLYWYSWSELPFMIFMVLFVLSLSKILTSDNGGALKYVALGSSMVLCFLTRYFGMFTFFVTGFYILILFIRQYGMARRENAITVRTLLGGKILPLALTLFSSGAICAGYLLNNKIQNGMPSGVSRSMWWDDYESLTNDLVKALLEEIFQVFHMETPAYISGMSYSKSVLIVITISVLLGVFAFKKCRNFSRESVFIVTACIYYGMFIVIRYFSSMDTFYYRFFAPATFLFTLGLAGLLIKYIKDKKVYGIMLGAFTVYIAIFAISDYDDHIAEGQIPYYDIVKMNWDEDYAEIPRESVVIFSTLDYRSLYYRNDIIEGTVDPSDTMETLGNRYYGSKNMCILASDATAMLESGIYDESINTAMDDALKNAGKYCVIALKQ